MYFKFPIYFVVGIDVNIPGINIAKNVAAIVVHIASVKGDL